MDQEDGLENLENWSTMESTSQGSEEDLVEKE